MPIATNPFAVLSLISAPAVLTNASCVLLFGTGNRYGRAIDRVHELAELFAANAHPEPRELELRGRQLHAAELRTGLIVRALTCFYTAVAAFAATTLLSLIGAALVALEAGVWVNIIVVLAGIGGLTGVGAIVIGAIMLARESTFSFAVLKEERAYLSSIVHDRLQHLSA